MSCFESRGGRVFNAALGSKGEPVNWCLCFRHAHETCVVNTVGSLSRSQQQNPRSMTSPSPCLAWLRMFFFVPG